MKRVKLQCVQERSPPTCSLSLFNICLEFVADNIESVESLIDFPEQVGENLWRVVLTRSEYRPCPAAIGIFFQAYDALMLPDVRLHDPRARFVSDRFPEVTTMLKYSTKVDLTGLGLGDGHPLLREFCSFPNLSTLVLCNNRLTKEGIRNLLGRFLMNRSADSFVKLKYLDLSANAISHTCVEKLGSLLPSLETLLASLPPPCLTSHRWSRVFLTAFSIEFALSRCQEFPTRGWAAQVFENRISDYLEGIEADEVDPNEKSIRFYRTKNRSKGAYEIKSKKLSLHANRPSLHLYFFTRKRPVQSPKSTECVKSDGLSEDEDVLSMYV